MNPYSGGHGGRHAAIVLLRLLAFIVMLAVLVGLGWWVWDRVVNNPLPYRDPEASRIAATAWK